MNMGRSFSCLIRGGRRHSPRAMNRERSANASRAGDTSAEREETTRRRSSETIAFERVTVPPDEPVAPASVTRARTGDDAGRYSFVDPGARRRRR